jgi:hypothetical protein
LSSHFYTDLIIFAPEEAEIFKDYFFILAWFSVKKNPYIIDQNHILFYFLLWCHFWINFNIFYTKTFGIVYILFVYLLIMLWT